MSELKATRFTLTQTYQGEWIFGSVLKKESVKEAMNLVDQQKGEYEVTVKKYRPKRSLSANAYFHVLCGKIAVELNTDLQEVKKMLVSRYGTIADNTEIRLPRGVNPTDFYPYCEWIGGDEATDYYILFKETHKMNSAEFARLINGTVDECHTLGIETLSDAELRSLYAQADTLYRNTEKR